MIQLKLKNKKGQLNVNSKEVKDILGIRSDIDLVQDISNTINQKLAYNELNAKFKELGQDTELDDYLIKLIYYNYYNKLFFHINNYSLLKFKPQHSLLFFFPLAKYIPFFIYSYYQCIFWHHLKFLSLFL